MASQSIIDNPPNEPASLAWGQHDPTFKMVEAELPALKDGDLKVKVLYLSNDPTQRIWINAGVPALLKRFSVKVMFSGTSDRTLHKHLSMMIETTIHVRKSIEALLRLPIRFATTKNPEPKHLGP